MKKLMLSTAVALAVMSGAAFATDNKNSYTVNVDGRSYTVHNVNSKAEAEAAASAFAASKAQATGGNAYNGGNSVNIKGDPAHTTSFNVGIGVGISARLGEGVRARSVTEAANWLAANGQNCLALEAMLEVHPDLKKLGKKVNCK